jgi:hypothetical protein
MNYFFIIIISVSELFGLLAFLKKMNLLTLCRVLASAIKVHHQMWSKKENLRILGHFVKTGRFIKLSFIGL